MKLLQRVLICLCILNTITSITYAQTTEVTEKPTSNAKLWHNNFYFIFGYAAPVGKWSKTPDVNKTITDAYLQNTGMGATRGVSFEMGSFFHFKKMSPIMHDRFKLGLNVSYLDFSAIFINPRWRSIGGSFASSSSSYQPFYFFGVKLGVTGTFSVARHMFVDVYANVCPTGSIEGEVYASDIHGHGGGYGTRGSIGVNYRILVFNFGLEMVFGNIMYNSAVDYNNGTSDSFKANFNTNTIKAKFGFVF